MNAIMSRKMAEQMPISRHFGAIDAIARSARASPVLQSALKSVPVDARGHIDAPQRSSSFHPCRSTAVDGMTNSPDDRSNFSSSWHFGLDRFTNFDLSRAEFVSPLADRHGFEP
jgi:hypothetical protein